jgi:hypothetical protein
LALSHEQILALLICFAVTMNPDWEVFTSIETPFERLSSPGRPSRMQRVSAETLEHEEISLYDELLVNSSFWARATRETSEIVAIV